MRTFDEVDDVLVKEYTMLMKARSLSKLDNERDMHMVAYLNMAVQATEKRGRKEVSKYPKFSKFFDYEKYRNKITGEVNTKEDKHRNIKQLILIANKKGG